MNTHHVATRAIRLFAATLLIQATAGGVNPAGAVAETSWLTGTALNKQLDRPVDVVWSGNPLRRALGGLSRAQKVAVVIDRRVDPGQKVDLQLSDTPLETALRQIARKQKLGVCVLASVVYFGPPRVTSRLRTIAALRTKEALRLPAAAKGKFLRSQPLSWKDFAVPRELLEQLAARTEIQIIGLDRVPHDLWAGAEVPPISLVDRLTLIAGQFDLTFEIGPDGRGVRLVPVPDRVALVRSYPGGRQPKLTAEKYAALVPNAQIKVVGDKVYVKGLLEDHERIASPRRSGQRPDRQPTPRIGETRFTMSVEEVPVRKFLETLAGQPNLEVRIDHEALEAAGISLDQRISVTVEGVTIDELLRRVTKPAELKFRRRGSVIEIGPAG